MTLPIDEPCNMAFHDGCGVLPRQVAAADSLMTVTWSDGHVSAYRTDWLRAHDSSPSALHERNHGSSPTPLCAWDAIPKVCIIQQ